MKQAPRPLKILDAGGTNEFWEQVGYENLGEVRIVLLNRFMRDVSSPNMLSEVGDACDLSRYEDQEFDVVFSNSVIGHVGDFNDQMRMANEIRRVGKRILFKHQIMASLSIGVPLFHFFTSYP